MPEVRAARSEELDDMLAVMCEAFGLPYAPAHELFYRDPYFDIGRKLVLVDGGEVISCLTVVDAPVRVGRAVVHVGGIAGVSTRASYRRRGHARHLLTEALAILRRQGYGLTSLFPYSYEYYRKLGWERAGIQVRLRVPPKSLPAYTEARHVRAPGPSDRGDIAALYDAWSRERSGCWVRDDRRWAYLLDHVKNAAVYKRGALQGYLLYDAHEEAGSARVLRVLEMVANSDEARRGLVAFLAEAADAQEVEYTAAWPDVAASGLASPGEQGAEGGAVTDVLPGAMFRIVDLPRCLEALAPNWQGFTGEVGIVVSDAVAPGPNTHAAVLEGDGKRIQVRRATLDDLPGLRLEGDVRAWSPVMVGGMSLQDALSLNRLHAASRAAAHLAAPLFPRRELFIPPADHF